MLLTTIFRTLSKKVSYILILSIALNSVGTIYPQEKLKGIYQSVKGVFSEKIGKLASTASQSIKGNLSSAYDKVRRLGPAAVISQLQKEVESLGGKVGYMGNCMIKGTCSQTERAAFIGTSIAVLALTTAVVGITLTIAATSKEVESVTKTTSQEVQGWGAQQIFQRLGNTIGNFKQSLTSLKKGMLARQLTRGQKKFLYGTALSIAALTTIAVGVGVASYLYTEKKKNEHATTPSQIPGTIAEPTEIPHSVPLAELAKPVTIGGVEAANGTFGTLFDRVVPMNTSSQTIFHKSLEIVTAKLDEKAQAAKQALHAVGEQKNQLIAKANVAYRQAVEQANLLKEQVKTAGNNVITKALNDLFGIKYEDITQSITQFNTSLGMISPKLKILSNVPTWKHLQSVMNNWASVQQKGYSLWQNLSSFLSQLTKRKLADAPTAQRLQSFSKTEQAEFRRQYPLAYKFDFLYGIYPKFLQSIATTNVAAAGKAAEQVLSQTGKTFQDLADIYSQSGVWGRLLLTNEMIDPLKSIGAYMMTIGKNLQEFTEGKPLEQLTQQLPQELSATSIGSWFKAVAWHPVTTVSRVKDIVSNLTPQMISANAQLSNSLQQSTNLSNTFMQHSMNMMTFIKQNIATALSQKPFQNYLNVAKQAVAKEAKISKELFNDVLLHTAGVVNYLEKLLTPFITTIEHLNTVLGKELVTASNLEKLKQSAAQLKAMTSELARLRNAAKTSLNI